MYYCYWEILGSFHLDFLHCTWLKKHHVLKLQSLVKAWSHLCSHVLQLCSRLLHCTLSCSHISYLKGNLCLNVNPFAASNRVTSRNDLRLTPSVFESTLTNLSFSQWRNASPQQNASLRRCVWFSNQFFPQTKYFIRFLVIIHHFPFTSKLFATF